MNFQNKFTVSKSDTSLRLAYSNKEVKGHKMQQLITYKDNSVNVYKKFNINKEEQILLPGLMGYMSYMGKFV